MIFEEVIEGSEAKLKMRVSESIIDQFAAVTKDFNPVHMSDKAAKLVGFERRVFHGAGLISFVSSSIARELPGPGSILLKIDSRFANPAYINDVLTLSIKVDKKYKINSTVQLSYAIVNKSDVLLMSGQTVVKVPSE